MADDDEIETGVQPPETPKPSSDLRPGPIGDIYEPPGTAKGLIPREDHER